MSADDYRKASLFATGSFDQDFPLPDLIGTTEILTEEHRFVHTDFINQSTGIWTLINSINTYYFVIMDEILIF